MNRRSFFTKLGLAAASIAVLPAATTYARHWVKPAEGLLFQKTNDILTSLNFAPNPVWETAPYELSWWAHEGKMLASMMTPEYLHYIKLSLNA